MISIASYCSFTQLVLSRAKIVSGFTPGFVCAEITHENTFTNTYKLYSLLYKHL